MLPGQSWPGLSPLAHRKEQCTQIRPGLRRWRDWWRRCAWRLSWASTKDNYHPIYRGDAEVRWNGVIGAIESLNHCVIAELSNCVIEPIFNLNYQITQLPDYPMIQYFTLTSHRPLADAVGPAAERCRSSKMRRMSAGARVPLPTNRNVPTRLRTM